MKMMSRTIAAVGLAATFATAAQAQFLTDAGSPTGAGAGVTGSIVSYVSGVGYSSVSMVASQFGSPSTAIPQNIYNGFIAVSGALRGNGAQLTSLLAGTAGGAALVQGLLALGANPTPQAAVDAIRAFNATLDGPTPAPGSAADGALRAARVVLTALGAREQ